MYESRRLHSLGFGIGIRLNELVHLRDKPGKREIKLITVLQASTCLQSGCYVAGGGWLSQMSRHHSF